MGKQLVIKLLSFLSSALLLINNAAGEGLPSDTDSVWLSIVEQIRDPKLDGFALPITDIVLKNVDFALQLDSGTLHLFETVLIKGERRYYGGYFVGNGSFNFKPKIKPEQFQVQRFYKSDSVFSVVKYAIIYFKDAYFPSLANENIVKSKGLLKEEQKHLTFGFQANSYYSDYYTPFVILKNLMHPKSDSFLIVHSINEKFDHDQYIYDPLEREEVKLGKAYPEWDGVEMVCSYSKYVDESMRNINGPRKDAMHPIRYEIEASIDLKGMLTADVTLHSQVLDSNVQPLLFLLHPEIEVQSITMGNGKPVDFLREKREALRPPILYMFLPHPPSMDFPLTLHFKYNGKIADRIHGLYYVDASTQWYPRPTAVRWSEFEMKFKSPIGFSLIASATLVDSNTIGDTIFTHWRTSNNESGVTFNIAGFEEHTFSEKGLPEVKVFHNRPLHEAIFKSYKEDWHKNVSSTILDPIRLFANVYGPPYRDYFHVTEILYSHGESFPGFINLPYWTFYSKNVWGEDLIIRSHEVAHQWWGSSVGWETYHDQWLSEGLATYSSLRYCNTVVQNERFIEKLREFKDKVFSVRKSWFASGEESGPIIQGYRTSSSKTRGDYQLIIYEKAALVLHMLRCHLTDWNTLDHSRFNEILKDFYQKFAGKNASTDDFRTIIEVHTGVDWGWFFNQWIYGNELPEYTFRKDIKKDNSSGLWRVHCKVEQNKVSDDFVVIMPFEIEFENNKSQYTAQVVRGAGTEFILTLDQKPSNIRLNPFEAVLGKVKQ